MKYFFSLLLFFSLFPNIGIAQDFHKVKYVEGYAIGWYESGIKILEREKKKYDEMKIRTSGDSAMFFYNLAAAYANLNESPDTVFFYFDKSIALEKYSYCESFVVHKILTKNSKVGRCWIMLDTARYEKYYSMCKCYVDSVDAKHKLDKAKIKENVLFPELADKLQIMFRNDQLYRKEIALSEDKHKIDSLQILQDGIDCNNLAQLEDIFKKYQKYPGKSMVGTKYSHGCIILQHAPIDYQKKYLPLVLDAYQQDNVNGNDVMYLLDRIHTRLYEKQLFGTQSSNSSVILPYSKQEAVNILMELKLEKLIEFIRI